MTCLHVSIVVVVTILHTITLSKLGVNKLHFGVNSAEFLPFPYKIGIWSVAKRVFVLIPTNNGEPRRVATHSFGNNFDLNASAKAPSYIRKNGKKREIRMKIKGSESWKASGNPKSLEKFGKFPKIRKIWRILRVFDKSGKSWEFQEFSKFLLMTQILFGNYCNSV